MSKNREQFGIWHRVYSFEHNYVLDSTLFGEPRFDDHLIWYTDSNGVDANVSVCLYPLPKENHSAEAEAMRFVRAKIFSVRNNRIRSLKVFGSRRLLAQLAEEFHEAEYYYRSPAKCGGDFQLTFDSRTAKALQAYKRSLKEGFTISENTSRIVTAEQINMLRSSVARKHFLPVDQMFVSLFSLWGCRDDVRIFDVQKHNDCVGFFVIHEWSPQLAFHLLTLSGKEERYFHDFTMGEMHNKYAQGGGVVMLGPAPTEGLEFSKKKWAKPTGADAVDGIMFTKAATPDNYRRHHFIWFLEAADRWMQSSERLKAT